MNPPGRTATVALLGSAQTVSWASSYYLPAMLAAPMARDLGVAPATIFAAFSLALLISAPLGPPSGRLIDRHGGRAVLIGTNLVLAAGLVALSSAQGVWSLFAAWALIGIGMGAGLYDAAFAALARLYGRDSRGAITGITLIAGFASTVSWPLSAWMEVHWGWRGACLGWAGLQLLLAIPLNAALPRDAPRPAAASAAPGKVAGADSDEPTAQREGGTQSADAAPTLASCQVARASVLLAFVFAAMWFTSVAMASHLPRLLQATGVTLVAAVAIGALIGPAQVAGRLLEIFWLHRLHPLWSARLATLGHPIGVLALMLLGPAAAPAFAVLHGMGNGVMTIARGVLPLALFGPHGYGARQGWLVMPSRVASALAPYSIGLALDAWGAATLWLTFGLVSAAVLAMLAIPRPAAAATVAAAELPHLPR